MKMKKPTDADDGCGSVCEVRGDVPPASTISLSRGPVPDLLLTDVLENLKRRGEISTTARKSQ